MSQSDKTEQELAEEVPDDATPERPGVGDSVRVFDVEDVMDPELVDITDVQDTNPDENWSVFVELDSEMERASHVRYGRRDDDYRWDYEVDSPKHYVNQGGGDGE